MILQEFSDEQYEQELQRQVDWRKVLGALVMAWCHSQDPERGLISFKRFHVISFTLRVKHLARVIELICGPIPETVTV